MSSDVPEPAVPDVDQSLRLEVAFLRGESDPCYKCSTCDSVCPVATVDEDFPGPKFQGPEQWRLQRGTIDVDPSIDACSNCLRCHAACPEDVALAEMHNVAREERVADRSRLKYLRDRLLANYGTLARIGSKAPRLTNWLANNRVLRGLGETLLGITAEREAPEFAHETFREWWGDRGGNTITRTDKRVAYFHGDYANYHNPEVGKALVQVYETLGYEVAVPPQRCSGTPMFANGFLDDAERAARVNVRELSELIEEGYDVVATCTSCSLALREEYPSLFDIDGIETVAEHTFDAVEYLLEGEELEAASLGDEGLPESISYHSPCHASAQGVDGRSIPVLEDRADVAVTDLGDDCSGMSGTYGWKAERYDSSMAIGADLFDEMTAAPGERAMTECPTCAMQMEHGTGYDVSHPIELLADALVEE